MADELPLTLVSLNRRFAKSAPTAGVFLVSIHGKPTIVMSLTRKGDYLEIEPPLHPNSGYQYSVWRRLYRLPDLVLIKEELIAEFVTEYHAAEFCLWQARQDRAYYIGKSKADTGITDQAS